MPDITPTEIVHGCPRDGSGLTSCCRRSPAELPRTDRITSNPGAVTCTASPVPDPALVQRIATAIYDTYGQRDCDRSNRIATVVLAELAPELTALADYRASIDWDTTCTEHARLLAQLRAVEERAERAEAVVAQAREIHQRVPVQPWPQGPSFSPESRCTCGGRWPCPTIRALELTNATTEDVNP